MSPVSDADRSHHPGRPVDVLLPAMPAMKARLVGVDAETQRTTLVQENNFSAREQL